MEAAAVAVARAYGWPAEAATARHSSASRVFPTPAAPWIRKPWHRRSPRTAENVSSASWRPTVGHGRAPPAPTVTDIPRAYGPRPRRRLPILTRRRAGAGRV